ncbi:thioredoxin family protein [Macrococcus carouselicus]|uniref:Thioredoxin n=1 Tax=Macrococcus carouselicus TaxID=69969 RepID=A0A9Q8CLD8_9STAP|nr:thioredoxin family protein [Macrococcus carouselicus]TDM03721.1 thioredoxin [Macrococcus carouselicus]
MKMNIRKYLPSAPSGDFIVFGYTPLCGTCKVAERMVDILPGLTGLEVMKINLNYEEALTQAYQLMSVPVLLIIREGQVVEIVYRFESVTNIYEIIRKVLTIQSM